MSRKKPVLITCIFCGGENVESSGEDVFPLWLVKKLAYISRQRHPEHPPDYIEHTYLNIDDFSADMAGGQAGLRASDQRHRGSKPVGDKLPDVCLTCNGGWMSRLEQGVGLILEGFIFGREKVIDPYDQFVIATWITKTCLTYDASYRDRWISSEMGSQRFYETGYPLFGVHAMIGHDPIHIPEGALVHGRGPRIRARRADGSTFDAVHFAFQFDHLLIRAIINCFDEVSVSQRAEGLGLPVESPHYVEVWPRLRRVRWPSASARVPPPPRDPTRRAKETMPSATDQPPVEPTHPPGAGSLPA